MAEKFVEAVRVGDWKLLVNKTFAPKELYNIKEDPLEKNDLVKANQENLKSWENYFVPKPYAAVPYRCRLRKSKYHINNTFTTIQSFLSLIIP